MATVRGNGAQLPRSAKCCRTLCHSLGLTVAISGCSGRGWGTTRTGFVTIAPRLAAAENVNLQTAHTPLTHHLPRCNLHERDRLGAPKPLTFNTVVLLSRESDFGTAFWPDPSVPPVVYSAAQPGPIPLKETFDAER